MYYLETYPGGKSAIYRSATPDNRPWLEMLRVQGIDVRPLPQAWMYARRRAALKLHGLTGKHSSPEVWEPVEDRVFRLREDDSPKAACYQRNEPPEVKALHWSGFMLLIRTHRGDYADGKPVPDDLKYADRGILSRWSMDSMDEAVKHFAKSQGEWNSVRLAHLEAIEVKPRKCKPLGW